MCVSRCPGSVSLQTWETCTPRFLPHLPAEEDAHWPGPGRHPGVTRIVLFPDPVMQHNAQQQCDVQVSIFRCKFPAQPACGCSTRFCSLAYTFENNAFNLPDSSIK